MVGMVDFWVGWQMQPCSNWAYWIGDRSGLSAFWENILDLSGLIYLIVNIGE